MIPTTCYMRVIYFNDRCYAFFPVRGHLDLVGVRKYARELDHTR